MATTSKAAGKAATSRTAEFFGALATKSHEPLLETATGTIRWDVGEGKDLEHWFVTVKKGDVTVSNKDAKADSIVFVDRKLFDDLAAGKANVTASFLRGRLRGEGDIGLALSFQRLFPGPPGAKGPERRSR